MSYQIGFISLGCPKNQVDAERMLASLTDAGMEITDMLDGADAVIINTCGFIDDAKAEAIENILNMVELKKADMLGKVIVTGCLAQRHQDEIFEEIPEVDAVFGIGANGDIAALVERVLQGETFSHIPAACELPLSGPRVLTTPEYWAYLKIAEGCSNHCSYCMIPAIRGEFRSRPMEDIIEEATELAQSGVKELILIAQDTTNYGMDLYDAYKLPDLLEQLAEIPGLEWLRLLYCYPNKITDELLEVMASNKKVLPYLDMPLQHINDEMLAAMNRKGDAQMIRDTIRRIREKLPDAVIRTTFITGFPGETQEAFDELVDFMNEVEFDRLGCFAFSPQEGTPAYVMSGQVEDEIKAQRGEILMQDQYEIMRLKQEECIGKAFRVLVEGYDAYSDSYFGRSYKDAPEIDACVHFTGRGSYPEGSFVDVEIFGVNEYDLLGKAD